nr:macroglobulin-complement related protein-like 1 [Arenicola marina]
MINELIRHVNRTSHDNTGLSDDEGSYFIVAPVKIRPNQIWQMSVTMVNMYHDHVNVRAVIRGEDVEIASALHKFEIEGTQMFQLKIPENTAGYRNYTLRVDGTLNGGLGGYIFENETELMFDAKQSSVFIETNKIFYRQAQTVLFRVTPVESNLMSRSGSMDIYVEDANSNTVRRWLSMQTNAGGVLDKNFTLSEQPSYGNWKIKVKAFGSWYEKPFRVDEYWQNAIDMNVSMPLYIWEDDYGLSGVITANLSLGQPAKGSVKMKLEIRKPLKEQQPGDVVYVIERPSQYFDGRTDVLFTMRDIREAIGVGSAANRELYLEAEVYDWYWNMTNKAWGITVVYQNTTEVKLLGDVSRTFKPNQTFYVYYAVMNQDGSPLDRQRRQVTISGTEETLSGTRTIEVKQLVRDDGFVVFSYTPQDDSTFIQLQAQHDSQSTRSELMTSTRAYSPTNSYIFIITSTEHPTVDEYMVFTVTTNTFVKRIWYLVTAAGNIITGDSMEMQGRQKTFSLGLSRDMMPEAHIIVWHVYGGEVIADSLNFFVNGTRINEIELRFNRGKDFTRDEVEINSWTDPSSYIGYSVCDYELWSYGYNIFLTETDVVTEISTYDDLANASFSHTWKLPEEQTQMVHFPAPDYGIDANTTFAYAGMLVLTDANVTRIQHNCNETMGIYPCMDRTCFEENQRCDGFRQCRDGQDEMGCTFPEEDIFTPPYDRLALTTRHYRETGDWLWDGHFVMPYGRLDLRRNVPDEPMTWVAGAFGISHDLGFGLVHYPTRYDATRPFFMRLQAPDTAVKGEQLGVRLALFNYWQQDMECLVMLLDSPQYEFVVVEEYGIVSSYAPRLLRGDIQTMIYLEKGGVYEMQFPILPIVDGCITVSISANAIIYQDLETIEICTKYDGVTNYYNTPYFIDLISSGSLVLPDLQIPVPELFIKPEERQHLYVPGSPGAYVGIVGDVVGPGFFEMAPGYYDFSPLYAFPRTSAALAPRDYLTNAETNLLKPYGGAEQNLYNMAYSVYNLKYLKATNQLNVTVREKALAAMNIDLQRQLSYMNADGSFSMFRDTPGHTPSTWVTAYVLKVLHDANEKDWELDFFVPSELLTKMGTWLCTQQSPSGAFREQSPLYDRKMWPKNVTGSGTAANYSLTAYALISLLKAQQAIGSSGRCEEATKTAQDYLEDSLDVITDVYTISIVTYALHLAGSAERTRAFYMLEALQRQSPYVYWADKDIPPNEVRMIDTIPYYQPRRWYDNEGYGVEATGYALMTYLIQNRMTEAMPIVKWLQTMRNTFAGQASTQDSITALQALVEFAKLDTNRALYNVEVTVQATSMGNFTKYVRLDSTNWPVMQSISVEPVWGTVRGRAQGTGLTLMQLATKVNVEYPYQMMPAAEAKYFDLELAEWSFSGRNFSIIHVTPCARWARPDISARSGLTVLEIHIPTGYHITNDVLREYAASGNVSNLRRAEKYSRKVVFYFDYLEHDAMTCVKFRMDRWFPVANYTIQHKLKVYDYYEPGMHNTTLYNTWQLFNLHVCQVCGSFQCPYCKFYNGAGPLQGSLVVSLVCALLTLAVVAWSRQPNSVSRHALGI